MQDEISKHAKKIYRLMEKSERPLSKKIQDITIEIFIIVFAVTLSIWLHSWSEHRHQQKEVNVFLTNLKEDLKEDMSNLNSGKTHYTEFNNDYTKLLDITQLKLDSLERTNSKLPFHVQLHGKEINDGNYEGFKSSGKLGYIENEFLKQSLLIYYQKNLPAILVMDQYYNQFLFKIIDIKIDNAGKTEREIYSNPKLKEAIQYLILIGKSNIKNYNELGLQKAQDILQEINKELEK